MKATCIFSTVFRVNPPAPGQDPEIFAGQEIAGKLADLGQVSATGMFSTRQPDGSFLVDVQVIISMEIDTTSGRAAEAIAQAKVSDALTAMDLNAANMTTIAFDTLPA